MRITNRLAQGAVVLGVAVAVTLSNPVFAQETEAPEEPGAFEQGLEHLGEGARLLWEGFRDEADPALRDLMAEMGPAWSALRAEIDPLMEDLGDRIGNLSAYERPVLLPNGDILVRRREPLEGPQSDMSRQQDNRDSAAPVEL